MTTKEILVTALNGILAIGLLVGLLLNRVTWGEFLSALGLLVVPGASDLVIARFQKPPPPPPMARKVGPDEEITRPSLPRPPGMPKNLKRASTLVTGGGLFLIALAACTPAGVPTVDADAVAPVVEAGVGVANDVCSLLEGLTGSATVETICATVDEIAQVVALILTLRQQADAGTPATCTPLPGSALCATKREIGQGIEYLVRKRAARLMLDAGAAR